MQIKPRRWCHIGIGVVPLFHKIMNAVISLVLEDWDPTSETIVNICYHWKDAHKQEFLPVLLIIRDRN